MNKGSFISKEESVMLQGFAVMLMVFHHLFGFPERIGVPYRMVFDFEFCHLETLLSYVGRICISIFAFNSGYGLYKNGCIKILEGYKNVVARLRKFYMRFWIVCIFFIPLGYILKVYDFQWAQLFRAVLGVSSFYNKEWWYVLSYLGMLILYPLVYHIMAQYYSKTGKYSYAVSLGIVLAISVIYANMKEKGFLCWLLCFIVGMLMAQHNVFEKIYSFIEKWGGLKYFLVLSMCAVALAARIILSLNCDYDYLIVPIIVFSFIVIIKSRMLEGVFCYLFRIVGKYSTYIWLTHTFFAYYYFQGFTYCMKYSPLIFIWCLLCSLVTGIILERIVGIIEGHLLKRK